MMGALGDTVYDGMSIYGRIRSYIGALIGIVVMMVMFYFAYQQIESPYTQKVTGTIHSISAHSESSPPKSGSPTYTATAVVHYLGQHSATLALRGSTPFVVGGSVDLLVDPAKPNSPEQKTSSWMMGPGLIVLGLLIGAGGVANAYFTTEYKSYAALTGTMDSVGAVGRIL
jgi:uncharacterized membrane-anchored protein